MLEQIFSSNAVQLMATATMGGLSYFIVARWPTIITMLGFAVAALLAVSFVFYLGEVYNYSPLYRRAFFHFGDDVTTWLTPIFMWAVLSKRRYLAVAVACGILFSGTKISLLLLLLQYLAIVVITTGERRTITVDAVRPVAMAVAVYLSLVLASPYVIMSGNQVAKIVTSDPATEAESVPVITESAPVIIESAPVFKESLRGYGNCREGDCLDTNVLRPLRHRMYSAVAGLWMTLQGGFPGPRYPNSPEKFADLMIEANPWGINDAFGVTREEWMSIGTVQTPYLQFGAGYGMGLLGGLLIGIIGVGILGVQAIKGGERGPFLAFGVFFLVNAVFNQTQPWLGRGPILFVMGFCAAFIIATFVSQRSISEIPSSA